MSRGPGAVERTIAALFRASDWRGTDRSFTVTELCREVFGTTATTRAQRVSVVRAARTVIRRARAANQRKADLRREAEAEAEAKFGPLPKRWSFRFYCDSPYSRFRDQHPAMVAADQITEAETGLMLWRATAMADGTLVFHRYDRPARVWAVDIVQSGLVWSEAEIVEITPTRISVVYKGVRCPLQRPLNSFGSWWRGVRFVGERDGPTAERLEHQWREQFGHLLPANLMPLEQARRLLGLPANYDKEDIIAAFRKAAKRCHPDLGGTAEQFRKLVEARDRLLAALGTTAPSPEEPDFTPKGYRTRYVSARSHTRRIGGERKLLAG